ncbi:DUF4296 domain-containing protein [Flavobacterium sp. GA093]|uniref:DUF4296 domain-containing protein n=1 Tax=Flavobacterium hydrocarbonoxydans TaxID=2683249 RepID=A0A6I4NFV7_9FLAO|nr:DUF4296 domain-containing protein [Flavobacterium hydrocarbonoxydans]MWB93430.1 DUF4296 domain-containing protein [Flavobacterium hydrocarbonoxydans]
MKNLVLIILVLFLSVSCKKELVKEPANLIEKQKMLDIMYDLSLLEAIKYQNPLVLDSNETSSTKFIFRKYKVDSLQFTQSNMYYAADYNSYKDMFDTINARLEKEKKSLEKKVKIDDKKEKIANKGKSKEQINDSLKKQALKRVNVDSIRRKMQLRK